MKDKQEQTMQEAWIELKDSIDIVKKEICDYYPLKTSIYKRLIRAYPHKERAVYIFVMGLLYVSLILSYAIIRLIVGW